MDHKFLDRPVVREKKHNNNNNNQKRDIIARHQATKQPTTATATSHWLL
jgi:hypothetical protein